MMERLKIEPSGNFLEDHKSALETTLPEEKLQNHPLL
jgi:hypothetical protein